MEFFTINTKLLMLASKVFTAARKVTSTGAEPDDYWFKSLMLS